MMLEAQREITLERMEKVQESTRPNDSSDRENALQAEDRKQNLDRRIAATGAIEDSQSDTPAFFDLHV